MIKKLIVDGADALKILKSAPGEITLTRVLRGSSTLSDQEHAKSVFEGKSFWVAEPYAIYTNGEYRKNVYTGEKAPKGYYQLTCRSSGTRMHYEDHRYVAEAVSYAVVGGQNGRALWVEVVFKVRATKCK